MKMFLLCAALIFFAHTAKADDSFEVSKDGKTYLCTAEDPIDPGGAADCAADAFAGPFDQNQATQLCQGAHSKAPAECAKAAFAGPFNQTQAITLCIGATTTGPAACAEKAFAGPFNQDQSITLCSHNGTVANADCAIRAFAGPYNQDQSVQLCMNNPQLASIGLKQLHGEDRVGFSAVFAKAMKKAALQGELQLKIQNNR